MSAISALSLPHTLPSANATQASKDAASRRSTPSSRSLQAAQASPDVHPFLLQLDAALQLEVKYRGAAQPGYGAAAFGDAAAATPGAITSGMRDGSAHVLRCLKVWYDLPSDVFFNAISCIDRFLAKMKAQPKHLSCIAVSAFHLACRQHLAAAGAGGGGGGGALAAIPEPADLVTISQSRCSPSDLLRMQTIIAGKLDLNPGAGPEPPVTAISFLRLMFSVSRAAAVRLGLDDLLPETLPPHAIHRLEILACDSLTLQFRPAEQALALLAADFQHRATAQPGHANALMGFIAELQKYCSIPSGAFVSCLGVVVKLLEKYNGECTVAHRQRLVWKLSNRTLRHLRPTDKLRATLPTIDEQGQLNLARHRSTSECSTDSLESLSDQSDSDREMEVDESSAAAAPHDAWPAAAAAGGDEPN